LLAPQRDLNESHHFSKALSMACVIASGGEAIQAGGAELDCFVAERVIGPATSGRTRWLLAMTAALTAL
jgi:hypothetical protein